MLTKYVGFNGQGEVRVISEDVNSFGDGDVVKVLAIDLHDLRQDGENDKFFFFFKQTSNTNSLSYSVSHLMAGKGKKTAALY